MNKLTQDMTRKMTMIKKTLLMVLMLTFGTTVSWADDYSGTYYIKSESTNKNTPGDYYLCPTKNWYLYKATNSYENDTDDNDDNGQPFLTTYQCKDGVYDASKAVWDVVKHPTETDCYYIIQRKTGRYMVSNGKIGTSDYRMRVHLESVANETALTSLGNLALFEITSHDGHLDIVPHSSEGRAGDDYRWLVVNFKNFNELKGSAGKTGGPNNSNTAGIIGLYNQEENHKWALELPEPSFYLSINGDELSVVGDLALYYTIDGETPEVSGDGTAGNTSTTKATKDTAPISLAGVNSIKYIVTSKDGKTIKSSVITYYKNPSVEWSETSFVYNGTAQVPTVTSITINEVSKPIENFTVGAKNNVNAGTAILTLWDKVNGLYAETPFTIAPLTVTLDWPTELPYTKAAQTPVPTITNLVTGDECTVTVSVTGGEAINMGTYTATATGLTGSSSANYQLPDEESLKTCSFNIVPATLTVTAEAKEKVYGDPDPEFTYTEVTGFIGDDNVSLLSGSLSRADVDNQNVGEYAITAGTLSAGSNYTISVNDAKLTITPAPLTITADNKSKNYGEEDPALTFTVNTLKYSDTNEDVFTGELTRETGVEAGSYKITQGTLALKEGVVNYTIPEDGFVEGVFTINGTDIDPVPTVTLAGWIYGSPKNPSVSPNPGGGAVTYKYKKTTEGEDKYTTTKPTNCGTYYVKAEIAAKGGYKAAITGTTEFTIDPAPLTFTADAKEKDYLDVDPEFTYTVSGLKNNETKENVVKTCVLHRPEGERGETVGEYTITKKANPTVTSNYRFDSFVDSKLTINPKNIGSGGTPTTGITIDAKHNTDNSWTVSVYNESRAFLTTDFTYVVSDEPDAEGNYIVTVTAQGDNCTGSAKSTYSNFNFPTPITETNEKAAPYYIADKDLRTSEKITPYLISKVNPSVGTISITPISFIPKDVPVLLLAESDVTGLTFSIVDNEETISESTLNINKLMYSSEGTVQVAAAQAYLYYVNSSNIGEFVLTMAGSIKQNRFYLYNPNYNGGTDVPNSDPNEAPARTLNIIKDETTGLFRLSNDNSTDDINVRWYTLDGRRLSGKPMKKGLYIKNGDKIVVK